MVRRQATRAVSRSCSAARRARTVPQPSRSESISPDPTNVGGHAGLGLARIRTDRHALRFGVPRRIRKAAKGYESLETPFGAAGML